MIKQKKKIKISVVAQACNPRTQEVEGRRSGVHDHPQLCIYFMGMSILTVCMSMYHMHGMSISARRKHQIPLVLELQTVVSCHVGAGTQTTASSAIYNRVQGQSELHENLSQKQNT